VSPRLEQILVATDLDSTTIYPASASYLCGRAMNLVEGRSGKPRSVMTSTASRLWSLLGTRAVVVPATGRTIEQYRRLTLPGRPPRYAVTLLGADIIVDGQPDRSWHRTFRDQIARESINLKHVVAYLRRHVSAGLLERIYIAADAYCVAVLRGKTPATARHEIDAWAYGRGWKTVSEGKDLYILPVALDKRNAVAYLARRLEVSRSIAGGDSLLDADMLRGADACIRPSHGSLHESGWDCETLTVARKAAPEVSYEILAWYLRQTGWSDDE